MPRPVEALIHQAALAHNLSRARALAPDARVWAVVKADAYGHGAVSVARHLETLGVSWFGVATAREALDLRAGGVTGDILVFISGHCVPTDEHWLQRLCQPLMDGRAQYTYGRQIGGPESRFSECRIFEKYYPMQSRVPQSGFFCNNANSAPSRSRPSAWAA